MKNNEFQKFDKTMQKLLSVPHSEIKKKLDEEKQEKKQKKSQPSKAREKR